MRMIGSARFLELVVGLGQGLFEGTFGRVNERRVGWGGRAGVMERGCVVRAKEKK